MRPCHYYSIAAATLLAAAAPLSGQQASASQRPNIVFLLSDDHAAHAISAYQQSLKYGVKLPRTPNLDRLAKSGMLFVNSFVTNSICGPARATVLTGQYGHINGVMTNTEAIHPTTVTFPKLLQAAGYETAIFGKWHLRTRPEGFTSYEVLAGQGPYYNPLLLNPKDSIRYSGYTLDIVTDRAIDWMRNTRTSTKPFMLMLTFNAPHRWWDPGPDQLGMYRDTTFRLPPTFWDSAQGRASPARDPEMKISHDLIPRDLKLEPPNNLSAEQRARWDAAYAAENARFFAHALKGDSLTRWKYQRFIADYMRVIASLDAQVGRVLKALDDAGLSKNTVVVYSSDQGFFLGDHGWFDKRWMYEESLRTPLLVRWPGVVRPGSRNMDLVMNLDLAETFLEMAGAPIPAAMQGKSIVPVLRGRTPANWRDAIYYQYFEYPGWHAVRRQYGVRTSRYKLIHYYEVNEWELFDLQKDPEELKSIYGDRRYAAIQRQMHSRLASLRKQYAVPETDPAPYYPWDLPPEYRRPGTPGSTRNGEVASAGLRRGLHIADSLVEAAIGKLTPGAVLLVAKDGMILKERAYGHAQLNGDSLRPLAQPRLMQTSTIFDMASVTKVMATTFAMMLLVDQGKVNLDTPVWHYLPDFRGVHLDSITVRHLLNHSSGLAQWQPLYYQASNSAQTYEAIRRMPLEWGVGAERHYSDLGFMLLGYIAERVAGKSLDKYIDEALYSPLGLRNTTFNPRSKSLTGFAATEPGNIYERHMVYDTTFMYKYRGDPRSWNGWRSHVFVGEVDDGNAYYANGGVAGHAGLFSTARDLRVLLDLINNNGQHEGKQVLSPAVIREFMTPDRYGHYLGWQVPRDLYPGGFFHTGFTGTYVLGVPLHNLSIVLLTNKQNMGTDARGFFPNLVPLQSAVAAAIVKGANEGDHEHMEHK